MKISLKNINKLCLILNAITFCFLLIFFTISFNKSEPSPIKEKSNLQKDSMYCYPGMKGGVYISDGKNFIKGDTISIKPFIEPWFLTEYDNRKIIPKYYLFEYSPYDTSFKCIDSILYADANTFNYIIKDDGFTNLFGTTFLEDNQPVWFTLLFTTDDEKNRIKKQEKDSVMLIFKKFQTYINSSNGKFVE